MSNYHFEVKIISRGKGRSITSSVRYISGWALHDVHSGKTYYKHREDVAWQKILLPDAASPQFQEIQHLCDEIELCRYALRCPNSTAAYTSLPNELPFGELVRIAHEFVEDNFTSQGLCVVAAIHRKHGPHDPKKNNPHVHMIVPTRPIGPDGFCKLKDWEHDKRKYITIWRERWAAVQNRTYEQMAWTSRSATRALKHRENTTVSPPST